MPAGLSRMLILPGLMLGSLIASRAECADIEGFFDRIKDKCRSIGSPRCERSTACCEDDNHRAGYPRSVAPWARCFPDRKYGGYYVGGGAPLYSENPKCCLQGERRFADEGTFGLDYDPPQTRVRLQWLHRNRN